MVKGRIVALVIIGIMLLTMLMPGAALAAAPATPSNISPASGETDIGLLHKFIGSAFSDGDPGNYHYASQWQISTTTGVYTSPVFDSGVDTVVVLDMNGRPTKIMPAGYLLDGTTYYWHVRYQDSTGAWSAYSTETSFTTISSGAPSQPRNISPGNADTNISRTPILTSSGFSSQNVTATHAASWWQISTTSGVYTSPVFDSGIDTSNLTTNTIPELSASTTYYWHVKYQDSYGNWSAYSTETSFTTVAAGAPNQPSNISPFNVATNISLTPTLESSAFSDPDAGDAHAASQWQITTVTGVYTSPVFDSGIDTSNLTTNTIPSGLLSVSATYYWHVRHQDSYGRWSAYSVETSFTTTSMQVPYTPSNISPASAATGVSVTPTLTGSEFFDPDAGDSHAASQWQISATTGVYTSPVFDSLVDTANKTQITVPSGKLSYNTTYYWHVEYQDSYGKWSSYSTETSFTTVASGAPNQPSNISPFSGATNISLTPTLESSAFSDPDAGDAHAASQWQISTTMGVYTSPVFDSGIDDSNLTTNTIPELSVDTTYYWHVKYQDSYGRWSAYSTETSFTTTSMQVPATPSNASPANAATGVSITPTLTGSEFFDPDAGDTHAASQWQISTTTGVYTSPVFDSLVDTANMTQITVPSGKLSYNTTYYWHVKYQDSYGKWSAYSTETSFTTVASGAPNQPSNISPFNGATDISPDQKLKASAFQGVAGRTHLASRWQVASSADAYSSSLFDSGIDPNNKLEIAMPVGLPDYEKTYYWHVMYQDDTGAWSAWSGETSFTVVANLPPSSPRNLEPLDGKTGVVVIPVLKASDFSDPDTSAYVALTDSHAASQWQVTATAGDYTNPVWDSGVENPTASIIVPASASLKAGTKYFWRVRYQDSHENWSGYSAETLFTTKALAAPVASFSADKTEVTAGTELVTFTDNSTPAGEIRAWSWSFGDGTTENWTLLTRPSNGQISHKYTVGGTQTVKLTVTNAAGTNEKDASVVVHVKPEASVTVLTAPAKAGQEVTFQDNSSPTEDITSWEWQFDDGTTVQWTAAQRQAAGGQLKHVFDKSGKHTASLIVKGELGESYYNKQINVTGGGGFQFGLWMIGVALAAVVVVAGVVYLVRARKGK